jgi:hypothetical protein
MLAAVAGAPPAIADAPEQAQTSAGALSRNAIEQEMNRRAREFANQKFLDVDYYRIHRKLAYPLPLKSLSIPSVPVPTISDYPWSIWMLWALEERVQSLGWAAEWFKNEEFSRAASRDLEGLSAFPSFHQLDQRRVPKPRSTGRLPPPERLSRSTQPAMSAIPCVQ